MAVYLKEIDGAGVLSGDGLLTAAVELDFTGTAEVLQLSDITANPLFDAPSPFQQVTLSSGTASLAEAVDLLSLAVFAASQEIWLATFHFTTGGADVTLLTAHDLSASDEVITGAFQALDADISIGSAMITVLIAKARPPFPSRAACRCWERP